MRSRSRHHGHRRSVGGMTLVEVMVATILFLIAVVGVFAHLTYGRVALNIQMHRRSAAEIAHSRLEELRTAPYDDLVSYAETDAEVGLDGLTAVRDTVVEDVDEDEDEETDYRRVTVTVTWTENGADHDVELVTLRSEYR